MHSWAKNRVTNLRGYIKEGEKKKKEKEEKRKEKKRWEEGSKEGKKL